MMDNTNVIISTNQISVKISDVSGSDSDEEKTMAHAGNINNPTHQQKIFLNLDVGATTRIRRKSAPSLTSIQESPVEKNLWKPLRYDDDLNRPPTPTTSKSFLARPSNTRLRRGSCPAILEPIKEGLFSDKDMQITARAVSLSPNLNRQRRKSSADYPQGVLIPELQTRLRSNSSPQSIETKTSLAMETLFPRPRRNSLGCATLDELKGQYKLLDSRSRVQEEDVSLDNSSTCSFTLKPPSPRTMTLSGSV